MNKNQSYSLEISSDAPLSELAKNYTLSLLNSDRRTANEMILGAAKTANNIKPLYLHVFQASQREIGRLWQTGQISVAQEHFCTAATQVIMSQLYPYIFSSEKIGRKLVATCVGGELHEIGIRMVADFFEMEGWDTYYLGANAPADTIIQTIDEENADLIAISTTMYFNVTKVKELITEIRSSMAGRDCKIMVGGYPFLVSPDLWKQVGSDGSAQNADKAVQKANFLTTVLK